MGKRKSYLSNWVFVLSCWGNYFFTMLFFINGHVWLGGSFYYPSFNVLYYYYFSFACASISASWGWGMRDYCNSWFSTYTFNTFWFYFGFIICTLSLFSFTYYGRGAYNSRWYPRNDIS